LARNYKAASSTTKTARHDIAEILLKVELNTINQSNQILDHVRFSFFRMATTNTKYLFLVLVVEEAGENLR
jgi:hypothetical protein